MNESWKYNSSIILGLIMDLSTTSWNINEKQSHSQLMYQTPAQHLPGKLLIVSASPLLRQDVICSSTLDSSGLSRSTLLLILIVLSYCVPNIMAVGAEHAKKHVYPLTACTREEYEASLLTNFLSEGFYLTPSQTQPCFGDQFIQAWIITVLSMCLPATWSSFKDDCT